MKKVEQGFFIVTIALFIIAGLCAFMGGLRMTVNAYDSNRWFITSICANGLAVISLIATVPNSGYIKYR